MRPCIRKNMAFAAIHVANFMVQAVLRAEVDLRDEAESRDKPVALVDGTAPLIHVVAANDAAWRAGIQLGMAQTQAQLCAVEIRRRSRAQEKAAHAARGFAGITVIPEGEEARCLSGLPVQALAPSAEALETLERWGIRTCAALAALPVLELSERLGQEGVRLQELARGAHARALVLAEPAEILQEEMELDDAVEDLEPLAFVLGRLLDQVCARLAARALSAAAIRVRFDLGDAFEKEESVRGKNVSAKRFVGKTES